MNRVALFTPTQKCVHLFMELAEAIALTHSKILFKRTQHFHVSIKCFDFSVKIPLDFYWFQHVLLAVRCAFMIPNAMYARMVTTKMTTRNVMVNSHACFHQGTYFKTINTTISLCKSNIGVFDIAFIMFMFRSKSRSKSRCKFMITVKADAYFVLNKIASYISHY